MSVQEIETYDSYILPILKRVLPNPVSAYSFGVSFTTYIPHNIKLWLENKNYYHIEKILEINCFESYIIKLLTRRK